MTATGSKVTSSVAVPEVPTKSQAACSDSVLLLVYASPTGPSSIDQSSSVKTWSR
ncbi:MAG: hypothetical protein ACOYBY_15095 [Dermatophilaceae bacterium]